MSKEKQETIYSLKKKLDFHREENRKLNDQLYAYRQTVLDVCDGAISVLNQKGTGVSCHWIFQTIKKRCML